MLEKRESETENEDCGIKLHTLHLRLKNCGIMGGKGLCRRKIHSEW